MTPEISRPLLRRGERNAPGPFIVTELQPCPEGHTEPLMTGDGGGYDGGGNYHHPGCDVCRDECEIVLFRGAFVESAGPLRRRLLSLLRPTPLSTRAIFVLMDVIDEGGSTTLPDGRCIEVVKPERAYYELWHSVPWGERGGPYMELDGAEIVAAWNAKYGVEEARADA